jgi:hypothetical protein
MASQIKRSRKVKLSTNDDVYVIEDRYFITTVQDEFFKVMLYFDNQLLRRFLLYQNPEEASSYCR